MSKENCCITEENRHCKRTNMLYDGDVMAKHELSKIIGEIQNLFLEQSILHDLGGMKMGNTCIIIDFMAVVRLIQKQFSAKTFKDLLDNVIYNAKRVSSPTMIHFGFDSYIKLTIKYSERLKRGLHVMYELANIYPCTALPSMMDSFWKSDSNKRKLIDCAYEYYLEHPIKAEHTILCSGYLFQKMISGKIVQQSLWQNVLVALRFSYHHFNRRRKQVWG